MQRFYQKSMQIHMNFVHILIYIFFVLKIIETDNNVRGPLLAQMELHRVMRENGLNADELLGDYMDLLINFYNIFGNRICCTNDLKLFLEYLDPNRRPGFASKLLQECGISSTTLPENVSVRYISRLNVK